MIKVKGGKDADKKTDTLSRSRTQFDNKWPTRSTLSRARNHRSTFTFPFGEKKANVPVRKRPIFTTRSLDSGRNGPSLRDENHVRLVHDRDDDKCWAKTGFTSLELRPLCGNGAVLPRSRLDHVAVPTDIDFAGAAQRQPRQAEEKRKRAFLRRGRL